MISNPHSVLFRRKHGADGKAGVALVLTLLIISMLVVVVVGFTVSTRTEQVAARNANYRILAEQLARDATGRALQKLGNGFADAAEEEGPPLVATQPGRISRLGQEQTDLFSAGPGVNINAATAPAWITGLTNDTISVGWENVQDSQGKIVGRVAYYVDDDSAKLPLNAATPARDTLNPTVYRPYSFGPLIEDDAATATDRTAFGDVLNKTFSASTISNWSFFFVPEQARGSVFKSTIIPTVGRGLSNWFKIASRFTVGAALDIDPPPPQTPWGTPKLLLNELQLTDDSVGDVTTALTDTNLTRVFRGHFGNKYGEAGVRQLAANIVQLRSDHWKRDMDFGGTNPVVGAGALTNALPLPAPSLGDIKKTNGIPLRFLGHVPFPMLKEISVSYAYGWGNPGVMTVRIFLECVLYNPYPVAFSGGGGVFAQIDKAFFTISYDDPGDFDDRRRGPEGTPNGATVPYNFPAHDAMDAWGAGGPGVYDSLDPASGIRVEAIPQIPAGGERVVVLSFDLRFLEGEADAKADETESFITQVIFDQIKLLADTNDPASVRDWISGYDLFNALSDGESPAEFTLPPPPLVLREGNPVDGGATLPADRAVAPKTKLVKRYDPRLRLALEASEPYQTAWPRKIWFEVPYQESVVYSATAVPDSSLPADLGFATDLARLIYNPDIPPILAFNVSKSEGEGGEGATAWRGFWSMPADLGKVFTGSPLRSLRMQPQPQAETVAAPVPHIPDWVLLDMIDFTDGTKALTMVNPNSSYASAGGAVTGFAAGLRSQLDVLTNSQATTNVANPLNPTDEVTYLANLTGLTNGMSISNLVRQAATPQWSGPWATRRAILEFPPSAIMLPSEIVEVAGFADYAGQGDNFKLNEYRIGALFPGLSTRSRFFKIYAVGEAFQGTNQQVAATALLQTLVEVNDSTTPPTVTTIYQYPPAD